MTKIDIKKYPNLRLGKKSSENNELLTELIEKYNTHDTGKAELISGSGAPASLLPENTIYKDTDTGDLYINVDGENKQFVADKGVKVYRALLSQSGTNPPAVTVMENTLGFELTLLRMDAGIYRIISPPGGFPFDKSLMSISHSSENANCGLFFEIASNDEWMLYTYDATGAEADSMLTNASLEILIYP